MICPRTKIILLLLVGILAIVFDNVFSLGLLTLFSGVAIARSGVRKRWLRRGAVVVCAVVWTTVFSQALFYGEQPRTPIFAVGPLTFWAEGVQHGLIQSLRMVSVSLAGLSVTMSTSPDRILVALQRLGVPPGVCFLAITALRFIPVLGKEVVDVRNARAHRGRPLWKRTPWAWLMMEVRLLRPIVARTLRRARTLAESLDIRGYDPAKPRRSTDILEWRRLDKVLVAASTGLTLAVVSARIAFELYALDIAYSPALRQIYAWVRLWV